MRLPKIWIITYKDSMCLINRLFQETLSFLNDHDLLTLAAIVWCVSPNIKQDATLQRQAEFIDQFDPGNIWNNVIIIVKQSLNPSQGKGSFLIFYQNKLQSQI